MRNTTSFIRRALAAGFLVLVLQTSLTLAQGKWTIPPEAETAKSTVKPSADVLKTGKALFDRRCARCHGPEGAGDGVDARPNMPPADLRASSAADNPDGTL